MARKRIVGDRDQTIYYEPSSNFIHLWIGEAQGSRQSLLTPHEARTLAYWLLGEAERLAESQRVAEIRRAAKKSPPSK